MQPVHATFSVMVVETLDVLIQTLGPDREFVTEFLHDWADRLLEQQWGISPSVFQRQGPLLWALIFAWETVLNRKLTLDERIALEDVYGAVSSVVQRRLTRTTATTTTTSACR